MDPFRNPTPKGRTASAALITSIIALLVAVTGVFHNHSPKSLDNPHAVPSILTKMDENGAFDAGYGVYPPYTIEDPNTKAVSGFSIDLVETIAKGLGVKVIWHRVSWNTFIPDIKRGEYDLIADPILMTIPRSRDFAFTVQYDYFADGAAVARKSDNRYKVFGDLNKSGVRIAVGKGFASETIARSQLPNAEIVPIQMGTDMLQLFNEVAAGRVDATISEGPSALRYINEHPEIVKSINIDNPAALIPGAFALRPDDRDGARAFSVCLEFLRSTGQIDALRKKWGLSPDRMTSKAR